MTARRCRHNYAVLALAIAIVTGCTNDPLDQTDPRTSAPSDAAALAFDAWAPAAVELTQAERAAFDADTGATVAYQLHAEEGLDVYLVRNDERVRVILASSVEDDDTSAVAAGASLSEFVQNGLWLSQGPQADRLGIVVAIPPLRYAAEDWELDPGSLSPTSMVSDRRFAIARFVDSAHLGGKGVAIRCSCGDIRLG